MTIQHTDRDAAEPATEPPTELAADPATREATAPEAEDGGPARTAREWWLPAAPSLSMVGVHALLIAGAIVMVGPLIWMVLTSFKTPANAEAFFDTPRQLSAIIANLWPDPFTLDAYEAVFEERPMLRYYLNSAIYTMLRMVPSLFFCSLGGFIFAKLDFPGRDWIFGAVIVTMMVPFQVKMLTLYDMMVDMRLVDTYWAVVVVGIMEPFGIFLFRQTIKDIPDDLLEAARIDGCSTFRIYYSIVLPLIRPTLAAYSIFIFMWSWSDFLWPLIVINTETLKPIEVGILGFSDINNPEFVKMMAASTIAVLPIIIFFLLMQRQFIRGVTMTGIKG